MAPFKCRRHGISGIIAALILFVMLFTIGTGYFLWVSDNNNILSHAQVNQAQSVQQQELEDLTVTPAFCGSCGDHLTFTAKNTGSAPIILETDYVDTGGDPPCTESLSNETLNPGATSPTIDTTCKYYEGTTATIKVLTQRGNVFSTVYSGSGISTSLSANPAKAGQPVFDTAILGGVTPTASGTVTYFYFEDGNCHGSGVEVSQVTVVDGGVPNSALETFNSAGSYSWDANYSGDQNNPTALSTCEPLTVNDAIPTVTTTLSLAAVGVGSSVYDSAALSGATSNATGTVQYEYFNSSSCQGPATDVGSLVTVTDGPNGPIVPDSSQQTFNMAGLYGWEAVYSGDLSQGGSNQGETSPCEPLAVQAQPSLSTILSATSILAGDSVSDNATLSGATTSPNATGTISFHFVHDIDDCPTTSAVQDGGTISVNGNGQYGPSSSQSFSTPGIYYWYAEYSGDQLNAAAVSPCEPLTVGLGLTTALSAPTITLGSAVVDTATLQFASGTSGTVTFYYFTETSTCTGTGIADGTTPISDGSPYTFASDQVTPAVAGSYSFDAVYTVTGQTAPYPTSPCEPLSVLAPNGANVGSLSEVLGSFKFYFVANCNSVENSSSMPNCLGDGVKAGGYYGYGLSFATQGSDCNSEEGFFHFSSNPSCIPVAFSVRLTNTEPFRSITLGPQSFLWLDGTCQTYNNYFFFAGHCSGTNYFSAPLSQGYWIVQGPPTSSGNGAIVQPYSSNPADEVTIPPAGQATLYFYCGGPCTTASSLLPPATNPPPGTYVEASLSLYGTYSDGTPFGQNIPFIASYVSPVQIVGCVIGSTYPNTNSPCWTSNTPNLAERPGTTVTLAVNDFPCTAVTPGEPYFGEGTTCSSTDSFPIFAEWVNSTGGITQIATNPTCSYFSQVVGVDGSEPPGYCTITFEIPSDTVPGDTYSMYVTSDGVNNAYLTVSITGSSSTTVSCPATSLVVGQQTTCTATVTGTSPAGTVTWSQSSAGVVSFSPTSCTLSAGSCSVTVTGSSAGATTVTATYNGDVNNQGSSGSLPFTVSKASPTITTTVSSGGAVKLGGSATDSGTFSSGYGTLTGTLVFNAYTSSICSGAAVFTSNTITVDGNGPYTSNTFTPTSMNTYYWQATFTDTDGNNYGFTSACGGTGETLTVGKATPTIATTVSSSGEISLGSSATDSGTFSGGYGTLTGTLVFYAYTTSTCSGTASFTSSTITVDGNGPYTSNSFTPTSTGTYYWQTTFTDTDGNNNGFTSACGGTGETLTVGKATPTLTTTLANSGTITIGSSETDSATLSGAYGTPTGSITFTVYTSSCTGTLVYTSSAITVDGNGNYGPSSSYTPSSAGSYYWKATFTDTDGNNNGVTSACETLTVTKASPTITTTVSSSGTITIGSSATDSGTLSGGYGTLTGHLIFYAYTSSTCSGTASFTSSTITVNGNGPYTSNSFTPTSAGTYYWQATFTDTDGNNNGFTSACGGTGETLTVNKVSPTITTTLSTSSIGAGGSVYDTATLSGESATAGGTVQYEYFSSSTCSGSATDVGTAVTVTNGAVPNSVSQQFNVPGSYGWKAVYSGDSNNNGVTSSCEALTITTPTAPTVTYSGGTVTFGGGSGYAPSTQYNYCLSSSSTSTSGCVASTEGTFTSTAGGAVPSGTNFFVPSGDRTGTWYLLIYEGTTVIVEVTVPGI